MLVPRYDDHAVFPTMTFGNIQEYHGYYNIYDATHCLGAKIKEFGIATIFSMSATKLVTSCEGGILLADDPVIYNHACYLRDKYGRMSEIHAKFALEGLKMLPKFRAWKKKVFWYYKHHLDGKFQEKCYDHTYNTIGMITDLEIPLGRLITRQYYEPLVPNVYRNTDYIYKNIICLPSWYGVDYKKVVEIINEYNSGNRQQLAFDTTSGRYDGTTEGYWDTPH
jgi:dTDP-4-amino-4,6-dideoxygalactose transaminase